MAAKAASSGYDIADLLADGLAGGCHEADLRCRGLNRA